MKLGIARKLKFKRKEYVCLLQGLGLIRMVVIGARDYLKIYCRRSDERHDGYMRFKIKKKKKK